MNKQYKVQYQVEGYNSPSVKYVSANNASQAKEKIKEQYKGKVKILSCVEQ